MNEMTAPPRAARLTSHADPAAIEAAIGALAARFGNRLVTSQAVREQHGHTLTWTPNEPPDAVVYAQSTEDVADIVKICAEHLVPVIASAPAPRSKAMSMRRSAASLSIFV